MFEKLKKSLWSPDAAALTNKGNKLAHQGRHQEALDCYNKALEINPKLPQSWNGKGNTLSGAFGSHQEALEACDKALEIDPKYSSAGLTKEAPSRTSRIGNPGHQVDAHGSGIRSVC